MSVRVVVISDTHGRFKDPRFPAIPEGDILIHCGDLVARHQEYEYYDVNRFFQQQKSFKHKLYIAGNHDFPLQNTRKQITDIIHSATYLEDQMIEVMGLKIYGSPWTPEFCNWAFMYPRKGTKLRMAWDSIPERVDILVTHGPAKGILDEIPKELRRINESKNVGCELLAKRIKKIKPTLVCHGHIHNAYGTIQEYGITYCNASICTEQYEPLNKPFVFDIEPKS